MSPDAVRAARRKISPFCGSCCTFVPDPRYGGIHEVEPGAAIPYVLCEACSEIIMASDAGAEQIAQRVQLRFAKAWQ